MNLGVTPFIALLLGFSAVLSVSGFTAHRAHARPLGFWLLGWAAQLIAAVLAIVSTFEPTVRPIVVLFGSLVAPLMLMGAYAHVGRTIPAWLPAIGVMTGAFRIAAVQFGSEPIALVTAAMTEPPLALYAAWLVTRGRSEDTRPTTRLLGVGFVLYAGLELADALLQFDPVSTTTIWIIWVVCGAPLIAAQIRAALESFRHDVATIEDEAQSHRERLKVITERSDTFLIEYDEFGRFTFVSKNVTQNVDRDVRDLIGQSAVDFFDRDAESPIKAALRTRGRLTEADIALASSDTIRARQSDGSFNYYDVSRTPYRTTRGELRILSVSRNVSDRVAREEQTLESERRLNRAEEIARLGSWEYDYADRKIYWSDQMYRLHGLEPASGPIDRQIVAPLIDPEDLAVFLEMTLAKGDPNEFHSCDYRIRRADDGSRRVLRMGGEIEYAADGTIERVVGASRDITEQIETENRLRQGYEHLDQLFQSNIVGLYYADAAGQITKANQAFLGLLGYTQADLPLNWRALTPRAFHDRDELVFGEIERTGTAHPYEKEFLSRTGEHVPMLVGCALLDTKEAIVMALDLSERKRAEAFIADQQRVLEKTIAERTSELLESRNRLIETERLASIGTLAAGVAHQINNPIGAILNSAEFALLCAEDEDAQAVFQKSLESNLAEARRCADIVKSMLQFARDEPTRKWVEDLNRVTRRAHRAIQAYAHDRGATVTFKTPSQAVLARISPIEIEQALVNILRNAIESRKDGVQVSLTLSQRDETAEIEIIDDGRGITEVHRDRLFEPFYSTRTREGGTGLGLSVAHGVIKDHQGEISIQSTPGDGTRIIVSLPAVEAGQEPSAGSEPSAEREPSAE